MTSEFDTPGEVVAIIKKHSTDPIALAGLDQLAMYFSAMHTWSHDLVQDKLKTVPSPVLGHYKIPKSDHWMRSFKCFDARLRLMEQYINAYHEAQQKAKEKLEEDKKKCTKSTGLCLLPCCSPELWKNRNP
jgi:hypothetical protein